MAKWFSARVAHNGVTQLVLEWIRQQVLSLAFSARNPPRVSRSELPSTASDLERVRSDHVLETGSDLDQCLFS